METVQENNYYTYIYLDPRKTGTFFCNDSIFTNKPFYVGKGKNDRCFDHLHKRDDYNKYKTRVLNKLSNLGQPPVIIIYDDNLIQKEALLQEKNLIDSIGLDNLTNLTLGGIGGDTFSYVSKEEQAKRIKKGKAHYKDPIFLKRFSEAVSNSKTLVVIEKHRIATKKKWEDLSFREKTITSMKESWATKPKEEMEIMSKKLKVIDKSYMKTKEYKDLIKLAFKNKLILEIKPYLKIIKKGLINKETKVDILKSIGNIMSMYRFNKVVTLITQEGI